MAIQPLEYHSIGMTDVKTRQQISAEQTERAIVQTAAGLFGERGYNATSINQIALEAGVAVQTIYNSVGSKRDLLSRVLDFAAAGDPAPTAVPRFMRAEAEREPDPRRIIDQLVEFWREALPRSAPVFRMIGEAAAVDAEAAALERERTAQRLADYETTASLLGERGALREGLTLRRAAATIFAIGHPDVDRALGLEGAWDDSLWTTWARASLKAALLPP
jgi:AcrR family transcriptional regulator